MATYFLLSPFGRDVNYLGRHDEMHPNIADYLFVLIRRFREQGYSFCAALEMARKEVNPNGGL